MTSDVENTEKVAGGSAGRRRYRRLLIATALLLCIVFWRALATWSIFSGWVALDILVGQIYSESPKSGYGPNAFGGYDHEGIRDLELAAGRTLIRLKPEEPYFRYAHASVLWRCLNFDDAARLFQGLLDEQPPYTPAHLTMAMLEWQRGNESAAEAHIDAYRKASIAAGGRPVLSDTAFVGLPRFLQEQLRERSCN
jgi:hypothetical protein